MRMTGFRTGTGGPRPLPASPNGPHACPKVLRHGFGVQAVSKGIALNKGQKWLGHAQLITMAIYVNAIGEEEKSLAARIC